MSVRHHAKRAEARERVARDCFTGRGNPQEVTVGDALADLLDDLRAAVRSRIGPPADDLRDATDLIIDRVCFFWPVRWMSILARQNVTDDVAGSALDAIAVIRSKVVEDLEARWGVTPANRAAIDAILEPAVIELANIWFSGPDERMLFRRCCWRVRCG